MSLPSFSVRRPVLVTMVFLGIVVLGLISFVRMPLDMFPNIEAPMISIITTWKGASATDVEEKVTKALEKALAVTADLDEMSSITQDNVSVIQLKFDWGANLDEKSNDIRRLAAMAKPLMPEEVDDPLLFRMNLAQLPVLILSVTTDRGDIAEHCEFIEDNVLNDLQRVPGVAAVTLFNERKKLLLVEVDRRELESRQLSMAQLEGALKANNLTLPAGTLEVGRSIYTIRAPGEYQSIADVESVIVGQNQGALVYLRDVAAVRFGLEERTSLATTNGQSSAMLMVQRESGSNTVDVAREVKQRIKELDAQLAPRGFRIATVMDMSDSIVFMIGSLSEAVYLGGAIVFLVVLFFLRRFRTSVIVAISIPTSLVAGFAMLALGGYTLNIITLAAMSIAVGLVVDDSIVSVDNIVRNLEQGKTVDAAAARGPEEVQGAITAATLTNAAIFMPVLFVGGIIGIFFTELAYVIIVTLAISLIVALALVPVLARRFLRGAGATRTGGFFRFSERQLRRLEAGYGRLIGWALRNRKKTVAVALLLFAGSLGTTAVIGVDYMPQMDGGMMTVTIELPIGANADRTFAVAQQVEEIIKRRIPEALVTFVRAGTSSSGLGSLMGGRSGPHLATIMVRVPKRSERARSTFQMAEAIRDEVLDIPGPVSVQIDASNPLAKMTVSGGKPLTLEVFSSSDDMQQMRAMARHIERIVKETPGAINVVTDTLDDNPELQLSIRRLDAARLGVPVAMIAAAVRTSMYGNTVTRYRAGDEDIDLFLKLRDEDRKSVADILNLTVPSLSGAQIRLDSIATVVDGSSPLEIRRLDMQRQLRVMADVSGRALGDVAADVERRIAADRAAGLIPDAITTRFAGDVKEQRAMVVDMTLALLLAILLVYMVMAAQFESLLDPFVVMFSVPFGITGALIALPLTGTTISLTSFVGLIMTVGVVVKNAIVLVDYVNLMRDRGMVLDEALRTGGERRLRPVLMTALAILGGMLPLSLSSGEGSEIWRPMGVAVIGGVLVSTLVTLVLIPCVYSLTDRWRERGRATEGRAAEGHEAAPSAA